MSDFLEPVAPGQPVELSAKAVNAWSAAARAHLRGRDAGAGTPGPGGAPSSLVVWVRNDTGADLPVRSVLALGDPVVDAAEFPLRVQELPCFAGGEPAGATDPIVITLEPIADGKIGRAVVSGVAVVDVNVNSASDEFAAPAAGQTPKLESASAGPARIVWKEGASGTQKAVVLLGGGGGSGGGGVAIGKLDGELSFGGSATMSVWAWSGSDEADTAENVTVYDWLLSSGQTVASGSQVVAAWNARGGRYYAIGAQCSS